MIQKTLTTLCLAIATLTLSAQKISLTDGLPLDYTYCGYHQSEATIPDARVAVSVAHQPGDQWARIQRAIDYVSQQKPDKRTGLRGAVLLGEGVYEVSRPLRISTSGVVLRGTSRQKTILRKIGVDRGAVVYIEGTNDKQILDTLQIDAEARVGTRSIALQANGRQLTAGSRIEIVRPSTKEWIASIGCDVFGGGLGYWGWKPGEMDIHWDRRLTVSGGSSAQNTKQQSSDNQRISPTCIIGIDAPLTFTIDNEWGGGYALLYSWPGRIHDSGVENITITSDAVSVKDDGATWIVEGNAASENHAWDGVYIDNAEDCWVRQCDFRGLAGSAVIIHRGAQQITTEDCLSLLPVSEIGGLRRRTFLTMGGKCLFQRCYSEQGINDFSAGYCAPGPNAFVQCDAVASQGFSGGSSSWATGLLFDNCNIEGGGISFKNLGLDKWGAGWNTANSTLYQCSASFIDCYALTQHPTPITQHPTPNTQHPSSNTPSSTPNYAIGCWAYCQGNGVWRSTNDHVNPYSLYATQLSARLVNYSDSAAVIKSLRMLERDHDGSTSPTVARASEMAEAALSPRVTMAQWINDAEFTADTKAAKDIDAVAKSKAMTESHPATDFTLDGKYGRAHRTPWWNGRTRYPYMAKADYAVTRFVPGMEQRGCTDRIDSVMQNIRRDNIVVWNQNYGLWYDRRRDDHERIKRQNGDVWAPFFEQAIARSGRGTAWDGLSKYDLSQLNSWYFHRVNELAEAAPDMLIINQHYFQHNILEAGAHWVDCPWRDANNIQADAQLNGGKANGGIGNLEPVPFTGDKRVFTADIFYDVTSDTQAARQRRDIFKTYIWNTLDALADRPNVYHSISEEFTGPQHFVEFWLQSIAEWQTSRGRDANVVLNATKDVVDAVMSQKRYADIVDVVEIEQWFYDSSLANIPVKDGDGQREAANPTLYAPKGGLNLAPRQHLRLTKTGHPTFADVYRCVAEACQQWPTKPVLYYAKEYDRNPWAVLLAGGKCPALTISDSRLAAALPQMHPVYGSQSADGVYRMEGAGGTLLYNATDAVIPVSGKQVFKVDQRDGSLSPIKDGTAPAGSIVWAK